MQSPVPSHFVFDHIPKTAGTTLFSVFAAILGDSSVLKVQNGTRCVDLESSLSKTGWILGGGHLRFDPGHQLRSDFGYITFLRDPIERAQSIYYHARHLSPQEGQGTYVYWAHKLDFEAFVASEEPSVLQSISNFYVRHFLSATTEASDPLEVAYRRLRHYFHVGITENCEESVLLLCAKSGWRLPKELPELNVSRHLREPMSKETRSRLESLNVQDRELVNRANQLHQEERRRALRKIAKPAAQDRLDDPANLPIENEHSTVVGAPPQALDFGNRLIEIADVELLRDGVPSTNWLSGEVLRVRVVVLSRIEATDVTVGFTIKNAEGLAVFGSNTRLQQLPLTMSESSVYEIHFRIGLRLGLGDYTLAVTVHKGSEHTEGCFHWREPAARFGITGFSTMSFDGITDLPCLAEARMLPEYTAIHDMRGQISVSSTDGRRVRVLVRNFGRQIWPIDGPMPVRLACRWIDDHGKCIPAYEGPRGIIFSSVHPRIDAHGEIVLTDPPSIARACRLTLVQEGVAWFDGKGGPFVDGAVSQSGIAW